MAEQIYVVKSGDTLSKIAAEFYGDANRWKEIFEANQDKIKNPNMIQVGQELRIPGVAAPAPAAPPPPPAPVTPPPAVAASQPPQDIESGIKRRGGEQAA
jgi:LysM repeat protein